MAITYTVDLASRDNLAGLGTVVSGSLSLQVGDIVVVVFVADDNVGAGNSQTISNSGSNLGWNLIGSTNTTSDCKCVAWYSNPCPDTTSRTVTVTHDTVVVGSTDCTRRLYSIVHRGVNVTVPVPSGNVFSGVNGTDVSQSITPTSSGSALWMAAGDWNATDTYAAAANCTLEDSFNDVGRMTSALVRPTTQPRTDAASFTIGETETAGKIAWIAFEVQSEPDHPDVISLHTLGPGTYQPPSYGLF